VLLVMHAESWIPIHVGGISGGDLGSGVDALAVERIIKELRNGGRSDLTNTVMYVWFNNYLSSTHIDTGIGLAQHWILRSE